MINIAFFGSPEFALPTLDLLLKQKDISIKLAVTQPDQPSGRGLKTKQTVVKTRALQAGLKISEKLPSVDELKQLQVEKIVVVAYGKFIPPEIVHGWPCINLHPSLLPKYRGPSPLQSALLNGDSTTGITTMLISDGMDDGDILLQKEISLDINTNIEQLHDLCAVEGAKLILETLRSDLEKVRRKQDEKQATLCRKIKNENSEIKPGEDIYTIHNKVRAIGGFVLQQGKRIKILKTSIKDGNLIIESVQPEGKAKMKYTDYKNGHEPLSILEGQAV